MKTINYKKAVPDKEIKEKGETHRRIRLRSLIFCLVTAFILYAALLYIERNVINADDKTQVYVAGSVIVEDTLITADNAAQYFVLQERSTNSLPEGVITDLSMLTGRIADRPYEQNEIVTIAGFVLPDDRISEIENPVEVSLNASMLSQVVGGVLRAGDYINIWSVVQEPGNSKEFTAVQICSHAYVTRAFTPSGVQIDRNASEEQATTVINIVIPADKEAEFNTALAAGTIRVGRCLYDTSIQEAEE